MTQGNAVGVSHSDAEWLFRSKIATEDVHCDFHPYKEVIERSGGGLIVRSARRV